MPQEKCESHCQAGWASILVTLLHAMMTMLGTDWIKAPSWYLSQYQHSHTLTNTQTISHWNTLILKEQLISIDKNQACMISWYICNICDDTPALWSLRERAKLQAGSRQFWTGSCSPSLKAFNKGDGFVWSLPYLEASKYLLNILFASTFVCHTVNWHIFRTDQPFAGLKRLRRKR